MKPILFNTEMVKAILEGRKTFTRRVMKPQPEGQPVPTTRDSCWPGCFAIKGTEKVITPLFRPGDMLWVRETFRVDYLSNIPGSGRIRYKAGGYMDIRFSSERYDMMRRAQRKPGWRPNENMPREAARIFLRVTDVRVERLQDITEVGAFLEGAKNECPYTDPETRKTVFLQGNVGTYRCGFFRVWESTLKPSVRAIYGWDANPWVWVIEFERTNVKRSCK